MRKNVQEKPPLPINKALGVKQRFHSEPPLGGQGYQFYDASCKYHLYRVVDEFGGLSALDGTT
jgi:hypothetical protein